VPLLGLSRVAASGALLAGVMSAGGRAGVPPNSCKFVSVAEVTDLIGKAVGGGQISLVADYPSAAAAKQEFARQMGNSTDNRAETGIGDSAFWTSVGALSITAVHGQRLAAIGVVGGAPTLHDRLHSLMVHALSR
jgi:hypothetical protein